jgi:hypothetical protein
MHDLTTKKQRLEMRVSESDRIQSTGGLSGQRHVIMARDLIPPDYLHNVKLSQELHSHLS